MSGLVDIWTKELSKLQEKGRTMFEREPSQVAQEKDKGSIGLAVAFGQLYQTKKPSMHCSEASVSMLVQWLSA